MRRREFITVIGGATTWPLIARARQPASIQRLGILLLSTPQAERGMEPVRRTLRGLGYVDGHNLAIEYRYAEGKPERLPDLAAALVQAKPDVLLALGGDVAPAVVSATQTIVPTIFSTFWIVSYLIGLTSPLKSFSLFIDLN